MDQRRWLVAALAVVVVLTAVAYGLVRESDRPADRVEAKGATTTTAAKTVSGSGPTTSGSTSASNSSTTVTATSPGSSNAPVTTAAAVSTSGATSTTTTTTTSTSTTAAPPFSSSIEPVTEQQLGSSWKAGMGCTAPEQLRAVNVSHWGYDTKVHRGRVIVAAAHAGRIVAVFRDVYAARFPIERMVPIDAYGGDDQASMRANNTSGFNCRYVSGTTKLSQHGYGLAIDVNPLMNPYVKGSTVDPPEGARYADRSRNDPGMIHDGDAVVRAFGAQGWKWGGYWSSGKDYQHFSSTGR